MQTKPTQSRLFHVTMALTLMFATEHALAQPGSKSVRPANAANTANTNNGDVVSLNFVNADIEAVMRAVGQFLKKDFLVDPRVKGTITLTTDKPVTRAEAYGMVLTALRFQGFAVVENGGVAKVLPEADAKFAGGPIQISSGTARSDGIRGDQIVTQIFRLNYESASNMVNMLRPLVTANNPITVNPGNNSLVITDYAENLQRLGKIIAAVDTPASSETDIFVLKNALAVDLAPLLQRLLEPAAGGAVDAGQRVTVLPEPRTNTLLLRATSPARLNYARGLIEKLDVPTASAGNIHIVYLKNADSTKLAQTLRSIMSGDTSAPTTTPFSGSSGMSTGTQGLGTNQLSSAPSGVPNAQGSSSSTLANPFASSSSSSLSGGGFIQADAATNALIITAAEPLYRNLRSIIDSLDVRRSQVFVESLIVEVTAEKAAEFGVQWQDLTGINKSGTNVIGGTNFGGTGTNIIGGASNIASLGQGLNIGIVKGQINIPGIGTVTNLGFLARALETDSNANILSTPNLLTLDNEEASIIVGQQIPFVTGQYAQTGTSSSVTPFQTIQRQDVGLSLKIRPQISDGGTVKMQIYQEVSSVVNTGTTSTVGPTTNKRAIQTSIQVDDGQIIVLGGLIQDSVENGNSQVPLLGNIPVLGNLFKYQTRNRKKTNLMVFLRPYVVRDENNPIFNAKYDQMRKLQIEAQPEKGSLLPDMPGSVLPERVNKGVSEK